ncbi:Uu.00g034540.m01.CDS01 [Anthostomella pinea]|uniref:Uu.00g034540.m01.CDS01 n=1 Tax=Anthostomella pinea TaxID=933095 RepID=A0AAI8V927_9PEZI|nr:Uu.00g034540.m01.CDS01 [Anthostomella pinea]
MATISSSQSHPSQSFPPQPHPPQFHPPQFHPPQYYLPQYYLPQYYLPQYYLPQNNPPQPQFIDHQSVGTRSQITHGEPMDNLGERGRRDNRTSSADTPPLIDENPLSTSDDEDGRVFRYDMDANF